MNIIFEDENKLFLDAFSKDCLNLLYLLFTAAQLTVHLSHSHLNVSGCFNSGAVLGFMLGMFQIPLKECDDLYRKLGSDIFKQNVFVGTMKMGWNHAFYDSEAWENILKWVLLL